METLWQDVKFGARMLAKNRGFTIVAVLTLAMGIGANTAIFSLLDAALLRQLPVSQPERLALFNVQYDGGLDSSFNYPLYADYRDQNSVFDGLIALDTAAVHLNTGAESERVSGMIVSGNFFDVLGVRMARGRGFLPEEDQVLDRNPVVVLSHGLWSSRFAADPEIVNRSIVLNGRSFTVVGVAPAGFSGTYPGFNASLYVPMHMYMAIDPERNKNPLELRVFTWMNVMGRLKPGVTREQAQAAMRALAANIKKVQPMNTDENLVLTDGSRGFTGRVDDLETPLTLLQVSVGLVLLIACANIANLLLSRTLARRRETAIRLALGAGRGRLIRQHLTESLMLSMAGGIAGLVFAPWTMDFLLQFRPQPTFSLPVGLDMRVLLFSLGVTLLSGLVFGLAPAWQSARTGLIPAIKEDLAATGRFGRWNLRNFLVIAQIALSLAVLVSAALCLRSLGGLLAIQAGFDDERVLTMSMDLGRNGYTEARGRVFLREMVQRVSEIPGVEAASLGYIAPLTGNGMRITSVPEGVTASEDKPINLNFNMVTPNYFRALGVPLLRGRDFSAGDAENAPKVIVVNRTLVERYWPGSDGVGKTIELSAMPGGEPRKLTVVGVVADSKYRSLTEPMVPTVYEPHEQDFSLSMRLFVRAGGDPRALVEPIRRTIREMDSSIPLFSVRTLAEQKSNSLYTSRLAATLLTLLGAMAGLLAAFGLYSVLAYAVVQRTREIGVRIALGADKMEILRLVFSQAMFPLAGGVLAGVAAAYASTKLLGKLLFGVSPHDPATFAGVAALLTAVALLACYLPARRATQVDPMVALRYE
jgi:putative ABC transport system permease protein